jgi:hypothetical protein
VGSILDANKTRGFTHARLASMVVFYNNEGARQFEGLYHAELQKNLIMEHGYRKKLASIAQRYPNCFGHASFANMPYDLHYCNLNLEVP